MSSSNAEAQVLITDVRQMGGMKMMPQHKLCDCKFNRQRGTPPPANSYFFCGHRPPAYSEQSRALGYTANASSQRCAAVSLKNAQCKKQQGTQIPSLFSSNRPLNLARPTQNRTTAPGNLSPHLRCPGYHDLGKSLCSRKIFSGCL